MQRCPGRGAEAAGHEDETQRLGKVEIAKKNGAVRTLPMRKRIACVFEQAAMLGLTCKSAVAEFLKKIGRLRCALSALAGVGMQRSDGKQGPCEDGRSR